MKGLIFTSFIDLVEDKFGLAVLDEIIAEANLPNDGAYTSVGTYDHIELINMVVALSKKTDIDVSDLVKVFGEYLFGVLAETHPIWLSGINSAFELFEKVDGFIHVEVKKLYPDAKPPKFTCRRISENQLEMIYSSPRCLGDAAEGLIRGCAGFYDESIGIEREKLGNASGEEERFLLQLQ